MKSLVAATALAMFAGSAALAADTPASATAMSPAEEAAKLANIGLVGQIIYVLDRAGWISTDVMQEKLSKARQKEVRGWIVERAGDRMTALYYGLKDKEPYGVFAVEFTQDKVISSREIGAQDPALSAVQRNMIRAREAAGSSKIETCGAPYNTVVIPPASETAPVNVYMLTPQTSTKAFPAGKHMRITAFPDGSFSARPFTRSCLSLPAPPMKAGEKPVGMFLTHLLDPTPTEMHVVLSLQARMPVYVSTMEPAQTWIVDGPRIARVNLGQK